MDNQSRRLLLAPTARLRLSLLFLLLHFENGETRYVQLLYRVEAAPCDKMPGFIRSSLGGWISTIKFATVFDGSKLNRAIEKSHPASAIRIFRTSASYIILARL